MVLLVNRAWVKIRVRYFTFCINVPLIIVSTVSLIIVSTVSLIIVSTVSLIIVSTVSLIIVSTVSLIIVSTVSLIIVSTVSLIIVSTVSLIIVSTVSLIIVSTVSLIIVSTVSLIIVSTVSLIIVSTVSSKGRTERYVQCCKVLKKCRIELVNGAVVLEIVHVVIQNSCPEHIWNQVVYLVRTCEDVSLLEIIRIILLTKITAAQTEDTLSYYRVRG